MVNFDIDEIDAQIIQILQKNPYITHNEIASQLNRSQPTVGLRIKKLIKKGYISQQFGINVNKVDGVNVVKVQMMHKKPESLFQLQNHCPFMIHAFKQSGDYNIMMFLACPDMKRINYIIDYHFRNQKELISGLEVELLTKFSDNYVVPIDIRALTDNEFDCILKGTCPCCHFD